MLVFQHNETAAMLVFQTKPVGVDPFFEIFAIFPAIRKTKLFQIKINANIFSAKIYSRVNIF